MAGNLQAETGIRGAGDLIRKMARGSVTGESAVKPEYTGTGMLVLEPTWRHILLVNYRDGERHGLSLSGGESEASC